MEDFAFLEVMEPETGLIQDAINHANGSAAEKKKSVSPKKDPVGKSKDGEVVTK